MLELIECHNQFHFLKFQNTSNRSIEAELSILQEIVIRLAYSYEAKLTNEDEAAINSLKCSDLTGYLHHIVDQLAVNRKIDQFLMVLLFNIQNIFFNNF